MHRVCIVMDTKDTLHTRLCYFKLSASFLYPFFTLQNSSIVSFIACKTTSVTNYTHRGPTRVKRHMQIVLRLSLCLCKSGFAKLTVDYTEDHFLLLSDDLCSFFSGCMQLVSKKLLSLQLISNCTTAKKIIGCFNHRVVTLVAVKLRRQWL